MIQMTMKAARVNAGLTQDAAAEAIGVTPQTISNWEKGAAMPGGDKIAKMVKAYGVPYDAIKFLPNNPQNADT